MYELVWDDGTKSWVNGSVISDIELKSRIREECEVDIVPKSNIRPYIEPVKEMEKKKITNKKKGVKKVVKRLNKRS